MKWKGNIENPGFLWVLVSASQRVQKYFHTQKYPSLDDDKIYGQLTSVYSLT